MTGTIERTGFETVEYYCGSMMIFEGFYDSRLWNSDILYCDTLNDRDEGYLKENHDYDILDWGGFKREVCRDVVALLYEIAGATSVVGNIEYKGISSPKYYNYETDKLIADVEVNMQNLKDFCLVENKDNFGKYLKEKFTSYDGYISFMPNNVEGFIERINENDDRCTDIMLDYYFLTWIYEDRDVVKGINEEHTDTSYHYRLYEYAMEDVYNYREIVYSEDNKYFEIGDLVPEWDRGIPDYQKDTFKDKVKRFISRSKFIITFEIKKLLNK